jgi:hypothetical protein
MGMGLKSAGYCLSLALIEKEGLTTGTHRLGLTLVNDLF